ncbi:MAG TPA: Uma2 family endonuclease [Planctomycetaceae bacterium]|jgi:Uma2 family endonuclease
MSAIVSCITADELLQMPRGSVRYELIRGELSSMSPAGSEHGVVTMRLSLLLGSYIADKNLGLLFGAESGFFIERDPDTVRAPDIAYVRRERIPAGGIPEGYWAGPPDLAVEVVSPGDTVRAVDEKVSGWLAAGTTTVWIVSPRWKTVTVHVRNLPIRICTIDDILDGGEVLPGFRCEVRGIFQFPSP